MKKFSFCMTVLFLVGGNLSAQHNTIPLMRNSPYHDTLLEKTPERITSTQQDSNVTLIGRWPNGPCHAVFVVGNYVYIGNGGAMDILDISNPTAPIRVGQIITPSVVYKFYVSGNYAYIAHPEAGFRIIDVSVPSSPTEVGFFDTGGWTTGVFVLDNYAYVASGLAGLRILDISTPSSPTEVGSFTEGYASEVYVLDNYAYVVDAWFGFRIIDVSTPSSPTEVGLFDTGNLWTIGVYVLDNYAYVIGGDYTDYDLRIIDVSTPSSPTEVWFFDTEGHAQDVYLHYCPNVVS